METVETYWRARRQEASHSAAASLRLAGIDLSAEEVLQLARRASGRYSDLSVMDAVSDFFRALNEPPTAAPRQE